ncbi:PH domain-containing protein [Streptomyces sp. SID3343]|nr:PH domain-containing protein [Streptomyces sp. SID3343]
MFTDAGFEDEALFTVRPHWKHLIRPVAILFGVTAVTGFMAALAPPGAAGGWLQPVVLLAGLVALLRWSVTPWLAWLGTLYAVSADRLTLRTGTLTHEVRVVPFVRVSDVFVEHESLIDRMLGAGTLVLVPVSDRDRLELPGLPHAARLQSELMVLVERAASGRENRLTVADPEPL